MIKFFRDIRRSLINQNNMGKSGSPLGRYFKYAIGEVLLVVIGILIALQINNWNEDRLERDRELNYLKNLKSDLESEIENNQFFARYRFGKAESCATLLNGNAPRTIEAVEVYTNLYENVFVWHRFEPNDNTFKELLSSGNLSLIHNDTVKTGLLELDKRYDEIRTAEEHMRREYEAYLYDPHVENAIAIGFFDKSKAYYGYPRRLSASEITMNLQQSLIKDAEEQHENPVFKNGLRLAFMNNGFLAGVHKDLETDIQDLIDVISREIRR